MGKKDLSSLRKEYSSSQLDEKTVASDPLLEFEKWLNAAIEAELPEPNAMNLATATADGRPSSRIVLLKEVNPEGFVFYTNYQSQKGLEMEKNPFGALTFFWVELERQVRIEGSIERVSAEVSDTYFKSRPRGSQIGAWSSPQSQRIASRKILEERSVEIAKRFDGKDIPRPAQWGGYTLIPNRIEFWQGRENRLHDRILYKADLSGNWVIQRVAP
jgi:pyridoxamine 5'-phosphate oxidase